MCQIVTDAGLNMAKPITPKMLAAVPPRDDNQVVFKGFAFKHPKDHHARAGLAIVIFVRHSVNQRGPSVMRCLGKFLVFTQSFKGRLHVFF